MKGVKKVLNAVGSAVKGKVKLPKYGNYTKINVRSSDIFKSKQKDEVESLESLERKNSNFILPNLKEDLYKILRKDKYLEFHSDSDIKTVVSALKRKTFEKGDSVYSQDSIGINVDVLYVIEKGSVELRTDNKVIKILEKGESFGSNTLRSNNIKAPHSVVCTNGCVMWTVSADEYRSIVVEKLNTLSPEDALFLKKVPILSDLTENQLLVLGSVVRQEMFGNGTRIITQGTIGHTLYFIKDGEVKCNQRTFKGTRELTTEVNKYGPGDYFGEGSLIEDAPRNADVVAVGEVSCLTLRKEDFNWILGDLQDFIEKSFRARVLKGVDLFANNTDSELGEIADCLQPEEFSDKEIIIREGDPGDKFYIIKQGEILFMRADEEEKSGQKEIARLFVGQYFGEGALLTDAPRRATAIAVGQVLLLTLSRSVFSKVFNELLHDTMNRDFQKRVALGKKDKREFAALMEFSDLQQMLILGAGSYGRVFLVTHKVTGGTYALKCMKKSRILEMDELEHVNNEKRILSTIQHPFVISMVQCFSGPKYVYALMEAVLGGELFTLIRKAGRLKLEPALFYIAQVVLVLEYLHSKQIVYRDLKPENILLNADGYIKVTDFGLAKHLSHGLKTFTICGTPAYAAPEIYNLTGHESSVDWWALGILTHELLAGFPPFDGSLEVIYASITKHCNAFPNIVLPRGLYGLQGDFVLRLMNPDPSKRLGSLSNTMGRNRSPKSHGIFTGFPWKGLKDRTMCAPWTPKIDSIYDTHNFSSEVGENSQDKDIDFSQIDSGKVIAGTWEI